MWEKKPKYFSSIPVKIKTNQQNFPVEYSMK